MTTPKIAPKMSKAKTEKLQNALVALNNIMSRATLGGRLAGIQYGGNRDIYSAAGYIKQGQESFGDYWGFYTRGDIAGRIVDMPANTTWRTAPQIVEEEMAEGGTEFTKAVEAMAERLKLWSYLSRVDQLAGIGRYGVLLIGVRNQEDLSKPLAMVSKPEDVIYLSVFAESNATIESWVTSTSDPRFGLPGMYKIRMSTDLKNFQDADKLVHPSRIIHVAENLLQDDVYGRPRLQRSLNRLFDLDKVAASTGEAYWQLVSRILQGVIDKDMEVEAGDLTALDEDMGKLVHDLKRHFYGQGVKLEWLSGETPDVAEVSDFYFSLIAGSCGIPKRILFGSELGELASSQDQENYYGLISERQERFAEPAILRAFIDRMISIGGLPAPSKKKYKVNWPALFEESDTEKAEANLKKAQAASALTPMGGNPRELVRVNREGCIELIEREPDDPMDMTALLQPPAGDDPEGNPDGDNETSGLGADDEEDTDTDE